MNLTEAILAHHGLDPQAANVGSLFVEENGLLININLRVANTELPAIVGLMSQEVPADPAPAEPEAETPPEGEAQ